MVDHGEILHIGWKSERSKGLSSGSVHTGSSGSQF